MRLAQAGHEYILRLESVGTTPLGADTLLVTLFLFERFVDDEPREETEGVPLILATLVQILYREMNSSLATVSTQDSTLEPGLTTQTAVEGAAATGILSVQ